MAISILGARFAARVAALSVEGLRKSATSSLSLNELVCLAPAGTSCSSFSLKTRPHLLLNSFLLFAPSSSAMVGAGGET